jgi:hypothetical protein
MLRNKRGEAMSIIWLLIKHVRKRYGDRSRMWVNRAVNEGRLRKPSYPFNNKIPAWREDELDADDLAAVAAAAAKIAVPPAAEPAAESVNEPVAEIARRAASLPPRGKRGREAEPETKAKRKTKAKTKRLDIQGAAAQ